MNLSEQTWDKANQTLYRFVMPKVPHFIPKKYQIENFTINGNSVNLPGINISAMDREWQGGKIKYPDARVTWNDLQITYLVDEDYNNWKVFWYWIAYMNNNKDKYTEDFDKIVTDARLIIINNWMQVHKPVLEVFFKNIWPCNLSDLNLTTKIDGAEILEASISFAFDRCELIE